jgi:hypothetical protein
MRDMTALDNLDEYVNAEDEDDKTPARMDDKRMVFVL